VSKKGTKYEDQAPKLMEIFDLNEIARFVIEVLYDKAEGDELYDVVLGMAIFFLTQLSPVRTGSVLSTELSSAIRMALAKPDDVFVPFMYMNKKLNKHDQSGNNTSKAKPLVVTPLPYIGSLLIRLYLLQRLKRSCSNNPCDLLFVTSSGGKIEDERSYTAAFIGVYCEWKELIYKDVQKLTGNKMARAIFGTNKRTADRCDGSISGSNGIVASYEHGDRVIDAHYTQAQGAYRQAVATRIKVCKMHANLRGDDTPEYILKMACQEMDFSVGNAGKVFDRVMKRPIKKVEL
jgi:hypothetical protein